MSAVKLPFSGPTVCERGAVALVRAGSSREGARDAPASLINGAEAGSAAVDGALPLAGSPMTGRERRVVRCTSSARLCIPVNGAGGTADVFCLYSRARCWIDRDENDVFAFKFGFRTVYGIFRRAKMRG